MHMAKKANKKLVQNAGVQTNIERTNNCEGRRATMLSSRFEIMKFQYSFSNVFWTFNVKFLVIKESEL